jgi:hypothetical protein
MTTSVVKWIVGVAAVPVVLFLVDRVLLRVEEWGWIFYRRNKPDFRNAGTALLQLQAMFEPRAGHLIERKQQEETDENEDDNGDPPVPVANQWRPPRER